MTDRLMLFRPLTGKLIHPGVPYKSGSDTRSLSGPSDISFTLPPGWRAMLADDGAPMLLDRGTLVVVERANRTIRNVGLVDHPPRLTASGVEVTAGGVSMLPGQSGPWEGEQGWYTVKDPVELFWEIWEQTQSYANANLGVRLTGDTRSGSTVGSTSSARWQQANRDYQRLKPEVDRWEARVLDHERVLSQRKERMFRALGLKRIGNVTVSSNRPDDPGVQADSTIWVNENNRVAYRWRTEHNDWIAYSSANEITRSWLDYRRNLEVAKARLSDAQYALEPAEQRLEEYADEAREEFSLHFWQDHNLTDVIEQLMELGPFEFREQAAWANDDRLDLQIEVGAPQVGVRRHELHLELGVNVQEQPVIEAGETVTGVTMFGAGTGSEVLSAQQEWHPDHIVRRIEVDTDKGADTKALTRAVARRRAAELQRDAGLGITDLVVHHTKSAPEGAFDVGDELPITGRLPDGSTIREWVRVRDATVELGGSKTTCEVEAV